MTRATTEGPRTIMLTVPMPPKSWHPNSRAHWSRKANDRIVYRYEVLEALGNQPVFHATRGLRFERARLDLSFVFNARRRRDGDNLIAWAKPLIDLLRFYYLVDDDLEHLEVMPVQAQVMPVKDPFIEVTLTEQHDEDGRVVKDGA